MKDLIDFIEGMHCAYGRFIESACAVLESQEQETQRLKEENAALRQEVGYQQYKAECREPVAVVEYRSGEAEIAKHNIRGNFNFWLPLGPIKSGVTN